MISTRSIIVALLLLLGLLQYELWFAGNGITQTFHLKSSIASQETQNQKITKENQLLQSQLAMLQAGKGSVEDEAREELGMVKPHETFYQFVS